MLEYEENILDISERLLASTHTQAAPLKSLAYRVMYSIRNVSIYMYSLSNSRISLYKRANVRIKNKRL